MTLTLPYKTEMVAVYQAYIDNNQVEKVALVEKVVQKQNH